MAHSKQAKKRMRQNDKRRLRNKAQMSNMRSSLKKFDVAVEAGDKTALEATLKAALSRVDKAAKTNLIHKNAAARKKSQLMKAVARVGK